MLSSSNQIESNINKYGNTEFINFSPYNGLRYAVTLIFIPWKNNTMMSFLCNSLKKTNNNLFLAIVNIREVTDIC